MTQIKFFRITLINLLFLCSCCLYAQKTDWRDGYIITNKGDTLFGKIDYQNHFLRGKLCRFLSANNMLNVYIPTEIQGYRFTNWKYYVSKKAGDNTLFLEFLVEGKLNLYSFRDEATGEHFYIEKVNAPLIELTYDEASNSIRFKQLLLSYTRESPKLRENIEKMQEPNENSLIRLAENYNDAVCPDTACLVYVRKPYKFKAEISVTAGISKFFYMRGLYNNYELLGYFWLPKTNEILYLKTGLMFSQARFKTVTEGGKAYQYITTYYDLNLLQVPIVFEYRFPQKIIRPKLGVGVSLTAIIDNNKSEFTGFNFLPVFNAGLDVKIWKKLYLTMNYDLDMRIFKIMDFDLHYFLDQKLYCGLLWAF